MDCQKERSAIVEASDGTITALARNRLVQLRGERWEDVIRGSPLASERIDQAFFDREGHLVVMTNSEIWYRIGGRDDEFRRAAVAGSTWGQFAQQPDGSLWALKNRPGANSAVIERLFLDDVPRPRAERIVLPASAFIADRSGEIWIAGDRGLTKFIPRSERASDSTSLVAQTATLDEFTHADGLTGDSEAVIQDQSGSVWSAGNRGIDQFKAPRKVRFIDEPLSKDPVLTVCPSGDVWIGIYGKPAWSIHQGAVTQHGPNRDPIAMYCDQAETVWLADSAGFFRYQSGRVEPVTLPPV